MLEKSQYFMKNKKFPDRSQSSGYHITGPGFLETRGLRETSTTCLDESPLSEMVLPKKSGHRPGDDFWRSNGLVWEGSP
jgi:hypothetical protein